MAAMGRVCAHMRGVRPFLQEGDLMGILIFLVCLTASTIGGICGIGGGVIIKPVLDALGVMSVSALQFLSGLTVLGMSMVSVLRSRKSRLLELRTSSALAVGAVLGGIAGSTLFQLLKQAVSSDRTVGSTQAVLLGLMTLLTLVYSAYLRRRIPSHHVTGLAACVVIGLLMGALSVFLGIGGGPINLAVLYYFFSMDTKKASANSLYIILCSQSASFLSTLISGTIPEFPWIFLLLTVPAGVLGGIIGSCVNKKISTAVVDRLFYGLLLVITGICVYNVCAFSR